MISQTPLIKKPKSLFYLCDSFLDKKEMKKSNSESSDNFSRAPVFNIVSFLDDKKDIQNLLQACGKNWENFLSFTKPGRMGECGKTLTQFQIIYLADVRSDTLFLMFMPQSGGNGYRVDPGKFNDLWNNKTNNNKIEFKAPLNDQDLTWEEFIKKSKSSQSLPYVLSYSDPYKFLESVEGHLIEKVGRFCATVLFFNADFPNMRHFLKHHTEDFRKLLESSVQKDFSSFELKKQVAIKLGIKNFSDLEVLFLSTKTEVINHMDGLDATETAVFFESVKTAAMYGIADLQTIQAYISLSEEERQYFVKNKTSINLNLFLAASTKAKSLENVSSIKIYESVTNLENEGKNLDFMFTVLKDEISKIRFCYENNNIELTGKEAIEVWRRKKQNLLNTLVETNSKLPNDLYGDFLESVEFPSCELLKGLSAYLQKNLGKHSAGIVLLNPDIPGLYNYINSDSETLRAHLSNIHKYSYEHFLDRKDFLIKHDIRDWGLFKIIVSYTDVDLFNFISGLKGETLEKAFLVLKIAVLEYKPIKLNHFKAFIDFDEKELDYLHRNHKDVVFWLFLIAHEKSKKFNVGSSIEIYEAIKSFHKSKENLALLFELFQEDFKSIQFNFKMDESALVGSEAIKAYFSDYDKKHNWVDQKKERYETFCNQVSTGSNQVLEILKKFLGDKKCFSSYSRGVILLNADIPNLSNYIWENGTLLNKIIEFYKPTLNNQEKPDYEAFWKRKTLLLKYNVSDIKIFKTIMIDLSHKEFSYLSEKENINLDRFLELKQKSSENISTMQLYEDEQLLGDNLENYL